MNTFAMLKYDPINWLMAQDSLSAIRARRMLDLQLDGDEYAISLLESELSSKQVQDGSFEQSPMKTAGVLNLLDDLKAKDSRAIISAGASYLISILKSQTGHGLVENVTPGSIKIPCDGLNANPGESLCGFFVYYGDRNKQDVMDYGAREMNFYREYEPLFGPKKPVRSIRKSSFDRVGPGSCYLWGLIPLCYITEALCRAGYSYDEQLKPAINVLLGVQRDSGGWCRNLGGHPGCTIHAVRVLGVHPDLRQSTYAEKAIRILKLHSNPYATLQVLSKFDLPIAKESIHDILGDISVRQRKDGTFGKDLKIERVTAVLLALKASTTR